MKEDCRASIAISYRILRQPRQPLAGGGIVFTGMLPHDCGKRRQIVGIAVVFVERGNPAFQGIFECLLCVKANGFMRCVRFYQNLQNAEFPPGIGNGLRYVGPVARLRIVEFCLIALVSNPSRDGLASDVIARATTVMEIPFTNPDEIDADRTAVQLCGLAMSDRTGALVRAIVHGIESVMTSKSTSESGLKSPRAREPNRMTRSGRTASPTARATAHAFGSGVRSVGGVGIVKFTCELYGS